MTVQGSVTSEPPGVVVHRTGSFRSGDRGKLRGVPVTSPIRTLIDLAALLSESELEKTLYRAVTGGCVTPERLRDRVILDSRRGRRGPAALRNLLPECPRASHVSTPLEDLVGATLRGAGFPGFVREYLVYDRGRAHYVDFAFPDERVAIEADGRRWHSDGDSFEKDRLKHNALTAQGWKVIRVTDQQLRNDPEAVRAAVLDLVGADAGNRDRPRPVLDRTSSENENA